MVKHWHLLARRSASPPSLPAGGQRARPRQARPGAVLPAAAEAGGGAGPMRATRGQGVPAALRGGGGGHTAKGGAAAGAHTAPLVRRAYANRQGSCNWQCPGLLPTVQQMLYSAAGRAGCASADSGPAGFATSSSARRCGALSASCWPSCTRWATSYRCTRASPRCSSSWAPGRPSGGCASPPTPTARLTAVCCHASWLCSREAAS